MLNKDKYYKRKNNRLHRVKKSDRNWHWKNICIKSKCCPLGVFLHLLPICTIKYFVKSGLCKTIWWSYLTGVGQCQIWLILNFLTPLRLQTKLQCCVEESHRHQPRFHNGRARSMNLWYLSTSTVLVVGRLASASPAVHWCVAACV